MKEADAAPGATRLQEPMSNLSGLWITALVALDIRAGDDARGGGRSQRSVVPEGRTLGVRVGLAVNWTTAACGAWQEASPFDQSRSSGHRDGEVSPMRARLAVVVPARTRAAASQPVLPPLVFEAFVRSWMEILRADYQKRHQDEPAGVHCRSFHPQ